MPTEVDNDERANDEREETEVDNGETGNFWWKTSGGGPADDAFRSWKHLRTCICATRSLTSSFVNPSANIAFGTERMGASTNSFAAARTLSVGVFFFLAIIGIFAKRVVAISRPL